MKQHENKHNILYVNKPSQCYEIIKYIMTTSQYETIQVGLCASCDVRKPNAIRGEWKQPVSGGGEISHLVKDEKKQVAWQFLSTGFRIQVLNRKSTQFSSKKNKVFF